MGNREGGRRRGKRSSQAGGKRTIGDMSERTTGERRGCACGYLRFTGTELGFCQGQFKFRVSSFSPQDSKSGAGNEKQRT